MTDRPPDVPLQAAQEAKRNPGGWVYQIDGDYGPDDTVPREAVVGAWKVDEGGHVVGEFIPNPNHGRPAE